MSNSRRTRRAKRNHNALHSSSIDEIQLAEAVESRFLTLTETWLRIKKEELIIPPELDGAMLGWRTMRVRHRKGDYRNSGEEYRLVKVIAQWTVDMNCLLRNQPTKNVPWVD